MSVLRVKVFPRFIEVVGRISEGFSSCNSSEIVTSFVCVFLSSVCASVSAYLL